MAARLHAAGRLSAIGAEIVLGVVVLGLLAGWLAGWHLTVVTTGSMDGSIRQGSVAITRPVDAPEVGDVIAFRSPTQRELVLHRVVDTVDRVGQERQLVTRGDANADPDPGTVTLHQVEGRVVASLAGAGGFLRVVRGPTGVALLVAVAVLTAARELRSRRPRGRLDPRPA